MAEYVYSTEEDAKNARRVWIMNGFPVSLITFDNGRSRYIFDVYDDAASVRSEAFHEHLDNDHYWNDIEQGRYDDDPNPYHGDYSEM